MSSSSAAFTPVALSAYQVEKLEAMMNQQVQDAILARSIQTAKDNELDSNWCFVGSLGQLKTFKIRGADPCSSTSSWATTLEKTTRATACNLNEADTLDDRHTWSTYSRRTTRSRYGKIQALRRTVGSIGGRWDPLDPRPPLQSFRTFGRVQGNYRDIVEVHHSTNSEDFVQKQKLLSPVVISGAVLRTIRATKDSYLGIKWLAENSFSGKRDTCFVEMVGFTIDGNGKEVGFVASVSVDVPECPELSGCMNISRVRMKRTMLTNASADEPKSTSDIFVMGATEANEFTLIAHVQYRPNMSMLSDISLVIDSHNIVKQTLALEKNWVPDKIARVVLFATASFKSCIVDDITVEFVAMSSARPDTLRARCLQRRSTLLPANTNWRVQTQFARQSFACDASWNSALSTNVSTTFCPKSRKYSRLI